MTVPTFPSLAGIRFPVRRTPMWETDVQVTIAGKRTAYARRAYPQYAYELEYDFLRSDSVNLELQTLLAFYNTCQGRANLFQFNDPDDTTATAMSFGNGDGSTVDFQLTRTLTGTGGITWTDPVWCVSGTASIFVNGVLKSTPGDYSIGSTGLVTFVSAPPAGPTGALTWTGAYNWFCRFDDDSATFAKFMQNLYELSKIKFSTELF